MPFEGLDFSAPYHPLTAPKKWFFGLIFLFFDFSPRISSSSSFPILGSKIEVLSVNLVLILDVLFVSVAFLALLNYPPSLPSTDLKVCKLCFNSHYYYVSQKKKKKTGWKSIFIFSPPIFNIFKQSFSNFVWRLKYSEVVLRNFFRFFTPYIGA